MLERTGIVVEPNSVCRSFVETEQCGRAADFGCFAEVATYSKAMPYMAFFLLLWAAYLAGRAWWNPKSSDTQIKPLKNIMFS